MGFFPDRLGILESVIVSDCGLDLSLQDYMGLLSQIWAVYVCIYVCNGLLYFSSF